jgi:hypothetical protein
MWPGDVKHVLSSEQDEVAMSDGTTVQMIAKTTLTALRSILASIPSFESRIKLTIHFSPSSLDKFNRDDRSLKRETAVPAWSTNNARVHQFP